MKKQEKVDYINRVFERFDNARNHGHTGSNWWYPKPFVIAYNVKLRSFMDVETLRSYMSERQSDYYSDDALAHEWYWYLDRECEVLRDEVLTYHDVEDASFAGRSGGWFEVEYYANIEEVDMDMHMGDINMYYQNAKELEKKEASVREFVEKRHKAVNEYINTPQFYKDIVEQLIDDDDIAEIYKGRIQDLSSKLK